MKAAVLSCSMSSFSYFCHIIYIFTIRLCVNSVPNQGQFTDKYMTSSRDTEQRKGDATEANVEAAY